jgi:integral membrane protein
MLKDALNRFRLISYIEGLSYLILVFIAMPIKYMGENPYYVKVFGMAHGVLFILFMLVLFDAMRKEAWNKTFSSTLFIYSLIPFGSFVIERKVKNA